MKLMRKGELINYLYDRANATIRIGKELDEAGMEEMYWPFIEAASKAVDAMSALNMLTGDMGYDLW